MCLRRLGKAFKELLFGCDCSELYVCRPFRRVISTHLNLDHCKIACGKSKKLLTEIISSKWR